MGERSSLHFWQLYGVLDQGFYRGLFVSPVHSQKVWLMGRCQKGGPGGFHSDPSAVHVILAITSIPGGRHYNHFLSEELLPKQSRKRDSEVKEITNQCQVHWRIQGRLGDGGQRKASVWESDSHMRK